MEDLRLSPRSNPGILAVSAFSRFLRAFLKELDALVDRPILLYLIGGSAITLAYDDENRTVDLDFVDPPGFLIEKAGPRSELSRRYKIHASSVSETGFSVPKDWRRRCTELSLGLKKLRILVPSVEDIVLGKIARLEPKDFEDILGLKNLKLIDANRLARRLRENQEELRNIEYRNNVKLLFREIFGRNVSFEKGKVALKKT